MVFGVDYQVFLASLAGLATFVVCYIIFGIWDRGHIPFLRPTLSPANIPKYLTLAMDDGTFYKEIKKRGEKLASVFNIRWQTLIVIHPEYITDVLSEYLHEHFLERGFYYSTKQDRVSERELTALDGRNWRDMRVKLTADVESEYMTHMFNSALEVSDHLIEAIEESAVRESDIDIREFLACFTTDFIKYSVYQKKINGFKYSEADSQRMRGNFLRTSLNTIFQAVEKAQVVLGLKPPQDDSTYYYYAIREDMRHREVNEECHLLQRLYEMIFTIDESVINTGFPAVLFKTAERAADFFSTSFDTFSTTMNFAIYELCQNPDIQDRVRREINEVLQRHGGVVTRDCLSEMTYLQQVIDETLRKYPPVPNLVRICVKDYTLKDTDITIKEGTRVIIPIFSLHRDEEYYPDPEKFDPERFDIENEARRNPHLFMPFGEGNIKCRGIQLTLLQAKIGLIQILRKFVLKISPATKMPLRLDPQMFLKSTTNLYIRAEKI